MSRAAPRACDFRSLQRAHAAEPNAPAGAEREGVRAGAGPWLRAGAPGAGSQAALPAPRARLVSAARAAPPPGIREDGHRRLGPKRQGEAPAAGLRAPGAGWGRASGRE